MTPLAAKAVTIILPKHLADAGLKTPPPKAGLGVRKSERLPIGR